MKKSEFKKELVNKITLILCAGMFSIMPFAVAMPAGGSSDTAAIASNGNTMTITGAANNVINWQSFSIAKNETVNFDANNYLNLVTGPDISNIYGTLSGGGHIFLVNPNGILFGSGAVINVGALTASTAPLEGINKDAFLAGNTDLADVVSAGYSSTGDISMALVKVQSADKLVLHADEIVLQNTEVLDMVTEIHVQTANGKVYIGSDDPNNMTVTDEQLAKVSDIEGASAVKLITDADGLRAIDNDMMGNYILGGDVDLSENANFMPIGYAPYESFGGYFNGMGYTISNLHTDTSALQEAGEGINTGFFVDVTGTARNFTLKDAVVIGGSDVNGGMSATGIVAGMTSMGKISNVAVTGNSSVSGAASFTGGIVGVGYAATITNVYNEADVSGLGLRESEGGVGGIAGSYYGGESVTTSMINSVNKGTVTAVSGPAGGIIGRLIINKKDEQVVISNVRNSGAVTTTGEGGIAGGVLGMLSAKGQSEQDTAYLKISSVLNDGQITADSAKGAIVGGTDVQKMTLNLEGSGDMYYLAGTGNAASYGGTPFGTAVDAAAYAAKAAGWGTSFAPAFVANNTSTQNQSQEQTNNNQKQNNETQNPANSAENNSNNIIAGSFGMNILQNLLAGLWGEDMTSAQAQEVTNTVNNNLAAVNQTGQGEAVANGSSPVTAIMGDVVSKAIGTDTSIIENTDMSVAQTDNNSNDGNSNNDNEEDQE